MKRRRSGRFSRRQFVLSFDIQEVTSQSRKKMIKVVNIRMVKELLYSAEPISSPQDVLDKIAK